ncbi:50S ribosomal protein L25/general stress protein Ctc [Paeniglutamicibacter psychrophenolicus]|uniref:50S ribosomal protein L25/general stress protein Ctc n=1 Tax=Paeniglutamicibacter psychrophenolicus TaxID=257454 RepID=UPI00278B7CA0|nr:50S ribosomal protein L25/general stress protein Ctc [Paeniglutamicibacter psychrophenolicus]MDQ0092671.1 large subunit ribosomal protein L25 [Paeniglutamicibacter psychrophenolicus]
MANTIKLDGELRTDFGKGAARQARRAGKIPAVIYGHGTDPVRVLLPIAATTLAVRGANALLNISVDGEETVTLVKDIQRHALRQTVDHLDLLIVKKGEKVVVEVSVLIQGELTAGSSLSLDHPVIAVEAEAVALPEHVVANIAGLPAGTQVLASDLILPEGTALAIEADVVVATIDAAAVESEEDAASAASAE